jgi:hypothetical protein
MNIFRILERTILCTSNMGNNVFLLSISNNIQKKEKKPLIYVIARQHPGETSASYIIEGMI